MLDNKYIFIKVLGKGGFGEVSLYKEHLTNNLVAIKKLNKNPFFLSNDFLFDEIKVISQLSHSNIISYKHYFIDNEIVYFVMEYCSYGNLSSIVSNNKIGLNFIWKWMLDLTETLEYMHRKGIVHHDIKPQNILFNNERVIKIADFGVANKSIGTRAYLPPEFYSKKSSSKDPLIDIYALGVTLIEVLTRKNPFIGLSPLDISIKHEGQEFGIASLPIWQQEIILKAINIDTAKRFQTMAEFHEAIKTKSVPYIIDKETILASKIAQDAKSLISKKKWFKAHNLLNFAKESYKPNVNVLETFGQYYLQVNNPKLAKENIEKALVWNPRLNLQKELAWLNLLEKNYSIAISLLSDHLQRNPLDNEAQNLLLECYYKTKRYEIGNDLANILLQMNPHHSCFHSNLLFFKMQLLVSQKSNNMLNEFKLPKEENPFISFNDSIFLAYNALLEDSKRKYKINFLFMDYRFKIYTANSIYLTFFENGFPKKVIEFKKPVISFGSNQVFQCDILIEEGKIEFSHHAVIINFKDDIWLINFGVEVISVNNEKVTSKIKIQGKSKIQIGRNIYELALNQNTLF